MDKQGRVSMEIKLKRIARKPSYTIGKLYVNNAYFCDTLEDRDRGLKQDMSLAEVQKIKVKDETAIPIGTYRILWTYSPRFKKMMPLIDNVPGFSGIRIHSGNTDKDTSGCVILGENKVIGKVINSKVAINKFYPLVKKACTAGENVSITIE